MRTASTSLVTALALLIAIAGAYGFETTYWVWHRDTALTSGEVQSLARQEVKTLYWHAGTLRAEAGAWHLEAPLRLPPKRELPFAIVPVLRLSVETPPALGAAGIASLAGALGEAIRVSGAEEAQVDFDCPDRLLEAYASLLSQCRAHIAPAKLSVTALAGWSRSGAFEKLQASADTLLPMFYDLSPDAPAEVREGKALPLIDAVRVERQLASWSRCRTRWFAGLPNFARVTIFDSTGRSRGHLRAWDWDSLCFNPAFALRSAPAPGTTLLRAESETILADTPVRSGETIACRLPERAHLSRAIASAKSSGAAGVAVFRLPGAGSQSGWSLRQMETLVREPGEVVAEFKVRRVGDNLELVNISPADLAPRLAGPADARDRGWQLELESSSGAAFREASPGEFASVFGHIDPDSAEPKRVPIALAQRLTFWFAELRAGQSRQTGLLQLAPGSESSSLRWRIPGSPRNSQWQTLE